VRCVVPLTLTLSRQREREPFCAVLPTGTPLQIRADISLSRVRERAGVRGAWLHSITHWHTASDLRGHLPLPHGERAGVRVPGCTVLPTGTPLQTRADISLSRVRERAGVRGQTAPFTHRILNPRHPLNSSGSGPSRLPLSSFAISLTSDLSSRKSNTWKFS